MDDAAIVDLYFARDEAAIDQTARKYGQRLRGLARRILENESGAEECENDTYLEAWNRIPPNAPRDYLFAYLGRIIRHLAIDECRRRSSVKRQALFCELTQELEACVPDRNPAEEALEAEALCRSISDFLRGCAADQRELFVRRYWYFDPIDALCARFGFSQSKVKTTLFRLRQGLKTHLEKEGYDV